MKDELERLVIAETTKTHEKTAQRVSSTSITALQLGADEIDSSPGAATCVEPRPVLALLGAERVDGVQARVLQDGKQPAAVVRRTLLLLALACVSRAMGAMPP